MSWENVPASDGRRIFAAVMDRYGGNPPEEYVEGHAFIPSHVEAQAN